MGERDRARLLLQEGKSLFDSLPLQNAVRETRFLVQLARLEPDQALARLQKLPNTDEFERLATMRWPRSPSS